MHDAMISRPIIEKRSAHICSVSPHCIKRVAVKTCEHVFILFLIFMAWLHSALHQLKVLKSIQEKICKNLTFLAKVQNESHCRPFAFDF